VDQVEQIALTRALVDIDSTTGLEGEAGEFLTDTLQGFGYDVSRQPVSDGRFNVFATLGSPEIVFATHCDGEPPFVPSREENGRLYGRGACDAKGIAIAQIAAAERLRASGQSRLGLLFVVGEERGSDGAKLANSLSPGSKYLINGEPTDNRLARATRGVYRARLRAAGRAAHTSQPELGESAIEKLVSALVRLRDLEWPLDGTLGPTFYTVGLIKGGVAPNVVPPTAEAEIMFRTVGPHEELRERLVADLDHLVEVEDVLIVPPVRLTTLPGFESAVFSFTTDIPFLDAWGAPLLIGPGSISLAHIEDEYVEIAELEAAVDIYAAIAKELLG
jgi:acetylornithine deacetylase